MRTTTPIEAPMIEFATFLVSAAALAGATSNVLIVVPTVVVVVDVPVVVVLVTEVVVRVELPEKEPVLAPGSTVGSAAGDETAVVGCLVWDVIGVVGGRVGKVGVSHSPRVRSDAFAHSATHLLLKVLR